MSQSALDAMDAIRKEKISKGLGSGSPTEEEDVTRPDDNKSGVDSQGSSPKKGKGKGNLNVITDLRHFSYGFFPKRIPSVGFPSQNIFLLMFRV